MVDLLNQCTRNVWKASLLHDNSCPPVVQINAEELNEVKYETLEHTAYSLDLNIPSCQPLKSVS